MLSSAGKNHRQEGGEGGRGAVCAGQDVKQPGYIIARALIMYDTGLMLYKKMLVYMILTRVIVRVLNIDWWIFFFKLGD